MPSVMGFSLVMRSSVPLLCLLIYEYRAAGGWKRFSRTPQDAGISNPFHFDGFLIHLVFDREMIDDLLFRPSTLFPIETINEKNQARCVGN